MRNFFYDGDFTSGSEIQFQGHDYADEIKHMNKVLRLQAGQKIGISNGRGLIASAEILKITRELAIFKIIELKNFLPSIRLHLFLAPLKGPKMDWLIEKITELGVTTLQPVITEFTVANNESSERADRWLRIAKSAVKQSGSGLIPNICAPQSLQGAISKTHPNAKKIFLHIDSAPTKLLKNAVGQKQIAQDLYLLIGPEGGFSDAEAELLKKSGWEMASLGSTILRGETAAIVASAIALHCVDFSPS